MGQDNNDQAVDQGQIISDYFNGGRNEEVAALPKEDMYRLLRELEQSIYWVPILKYTQQRLLVAQSAIHVIDPVKDPTGISRNQGAMIGLVDLQNGVIQLVSEHKSKMAAETKEVKE